MMTITKVEEKPVLTEVKQEVIPLKFNLEIPEFNIAQSNRELAEQGLREHIKDINYGRINK